ncbi:ProQ/FINO family protein [Vreelandella gomseomensis]|uniref:ProQ/FINO family protein n=1 Tax=Vreelandella gomseomensis TaxID=370766 RepID=A0ABU1G9N3_9GAMM|nr:ProQ/FINO family protein [Halomonas gomseomensis]MDR5873784.1 ProQ/FINO family protein [Halomonas gomseomensis]
MSISPESESPRQLLDDLERRWEIAQAELITLREENAELRRLLAQAQEAASSQTSDGDALPVEPAEKDEPPSPHALLEQWYQRYPEAFFKGHTQPLKVGIHHDLAACEPWSGKLIRRALANYVNLPRYVKSVREGARRIDLAGNDAGVVDAEAARHAAEKRAQQAAATPVERSRRKQGGQSSPKATSPQKKAPSPKTVKAEKTPSEPDLSEKSLSLEDKLLGLKQKFQSR